MALRFDFKQSLRVDGSAFHPGSGGGGGSFYMGRQDQPDEPEQERDDEEEGGLALDACAFQPSLDSRLRLIPRVEDDTDYEALGEDLKGRVRYLKLAIAHMERTLDRRTHAEVGLVTVYRSA